MSHQLEELLLRWEESRRRGRALSVEELCRDCPELRAHLQAEVTALEKMDRILTLEGEDQPVARGERPGARCDYLRPAWEPVPGYRLEARLGRGGFGEVWKAIGPGGFPVALKFVPLHGEVGAKELESLEVLKKLHHPNLLATFGAWRAAGFLVIAMELADRTLLDRLHEVMGQSLPGIPREELIRYMQEAARGIDYLNRPGHHLGDGLAVAVQHRDIKPQNILLMGGGVKIADFGLLRILKGMATEHTGRLTLAYAAPEFLLGQTTRASDQYSLAVTYCHLRGGRLPFTGGPGQIMQGHLQGAPDLTMLPAGERDPVGRALQKDPGRRWASCAEFVGVLAQRAAAAPTPVANAIAGNNLLPSPTRAKTFTPRRVALLGSLAGVCVTAAVLWALVGSPPEKPSPKPGRDKAGQAPPPTPPAKPTPADLMRQDLESLSGTWHLLSYSGQGKTYWPGDYQMEIRGNQMAMWLGKRRPGSSPPWTFAIDPTKSPKTIDRHRGKTVSHGIYKLEGGRLTVAYSPNMVRSRPKKFDSLASRVARIRCARA